MREAGRAVESGRLGRWKLSLCWGLGFAMVFVIASGHGGALPVSSSPGYHQSPSSDAHGPSIIGRLMIPSMMERRIRALNNERQKEMVTDTNKLLKLAQDLNDEIAAKNAGTLTFDQLRKIAEIEKLAHSVKEKMAMRSRRADADRAPGAPCVPYPIVGSLAARQQRSNGWNGQASAPRKLLQSVQVVPGEGVLPAGQGSLCPRWLRARSPRSLRRLSSLRAGRDGLRFCVWGSTGMEVAISSARASGTHPASDELSAQQKIEIYRLMFLSRSVDDREVLLKRQQKTFFQISTAGHEALQVGAALALRPGYDWFFPYYRDGALCLAFGVTPYDMMLQAAGAATDPASGGRQMPRHWSSRALHIVSTSSSTATQLLHAVGCAEAGRAFSRHPEIAAKAEGDYRAFHDVDFHGDEVALACVGEGSTSQGEFWEAINTASNQKLPVIFCIEDNGYAISVPVEVNTPGGNISRLVANFPNFHFSEIDGNDPVASLRAFQAAAAHCRAGHGPALVHGHCVRLYSHSLSDDDRNYRSASEREADQMCDPIAAHALAADRRRDSDGQRDRRAGTEARSRSRRSRRARACKRRCQRSRESPSTFTPKISIRPAPPSPRSNRKSPPSPTERLQPDTKVPARTPWPT